MTYDPARPRYTLPFAGKDYEVEGSFALIEAVEYSLKESILSINMRVLDMPIYEMSRVLTAILSTSGHKLALKEVGDLLWNNIGFGTTEYMTLCLHVHSFLRICVAKPADREEEARKVGEIMGKRAAQPVSPGDSISASA